MNLAHLRTVIWLRWRLRRNQLRRAGTLNAVLLAIVAGLAVALSIGMFVGGWLAGSTILADKSPVTLLLVWDGLVVAFLFSWMVGLMTELQRSEVLTLDKFLHLPVTPNGVFLINYLSSLVRFSLIVFVPAMAGLAIGLTRSRGAPMLWTFLLMAAFFLMVTAVTYQFQGWLASLMANPRRRRTIIVFVTIVFVLLAQIPNLINLWMPRDLTGRHQADAIHKDQLELLQRRGRSELTEEQYRELLEEMHRRHAAVAERQAHDKLDLAGRYARILSAALPPGWLPLGVSAAAEGGAIAPLAGILGMTLIGSVSLWRAYRTILRLYKGEFTAKSSPSAPKLGKRARNEGRNPARLSFMERPVRGLSEPSAAVARAAFRSILRAPETKMLLLTPIFMVIVFGSMLFRPSEADSPAIRALLPFAAMAMTLLGLMQVAGNQFAFDRGGFRVFVLSPVSRRDILLGKNMALAPLVFVMGGAMIVLLQFVRPMRFDHLLATIPLSMSMFLIFLLMANALSIGSPMPIAAGSLKPANPRVATILLQLLFVLMFPIAMAPTMLPLAIEQWIPTPAWAHGWPLHLLLSTAECAIVVVLYRVLLTSQGRWLHEREQKILQTITTPVQ